MSNIYWSFLFGLELLFFFYFSKIFANYLSEKRMKFFVFLLCDILSVVLLGGQRQNLW